MAFTAGPEDADHRGGEEPTASALFAVLWNLLAEMLGTAATAAIVRRGAQRATPNHADLADLVIVRDHLRYRYTLPGAWSQAAERGNVPLRALAREIGRLLLELTGTVVIRVLEQSPELRAGGLVWRSEDAN
jgi:hypothetical protein